MEQVPITIINSELGTGHKSIFSCYDNHNKNFTFTVLYSLGMFTEAEGAEDQVKF